MDGNETEFQIETQIIEFPTERAIEATLAKVSTEYFSTRNPNNLPIVGVMDPDSQVLTLSMHSFVHQEIMMLVNEINQRGMK